MDTGWYGWPLERVVLLLIGLMFFMIFVQVTLFHYRQNFRHWSMWIPVIATPVDGFLLVWFAFYAVPWLLLTIQTLMWVSLFAGGFGSFMHARGIGQRVGGYEMRNFLVGPPLMLPGMITGSSILTLVVLYWSF
ncbi:MAG TPA: hypothetical protein VFV52_09740 [Bacilli bacterium]|nr:hypothetical protein [Bacilli bacterium]